jgi:signal transduction histidine kinase/CheY-like chemotaxis protein
VAAARRFHWLLYGTSLLLLAILVYLGLRLHAGALAARRRAAFEHVVAENSTRFINCPPVETEARLKQVLSELCRAIGVERAYVVLDEKPTRVHAWSMDGLAYPPGWPDQALALSAQLGAARPDIVTVPDVDALPPGKVRATLAAAGVRGWAFVPLIRPGRARGIMGFDAFRPAWDAVFPLPVVRLAGDAVANAIEREFLERDQARLTTRLERARRMEIVGGIASGIAHNFNNIIGAILGYAEMAEARLMPDSKPARDVDEIRRAAERGRDLIESIFTFGRRRNARGRPVQMRALLDEATSLLNASLPQGIELTTEEIPADVIAFGDPVQLQQVIINLCTNASHAMAGEGRIEVTVDLQDIRHAHVLTHGLLAPGQYVRLSVSDAGRGIDESTFRRLFEPFFTTRRAGTGLGLATVREIVRDHDGAMNVWSVPGRGSRFEAWLPAAVADSTAASRADEEATLPFGGGETVLIIDDERERLLRDEEMLAALGYEPVGFEHAADALAACRAAPGRFDALVVSDTLPAPGGIHLARALHEIVVRRPILLATASTLDVGVDALTEAGISEVLRKPLTSTEVAAALARLLLAHPKSNGALRP